MHMLTDHAELLRLSGDDPWVRLAVDPARPLRAWRDPSSGLLAVARVRPRARRTDVVVLAPAPAAARDHHDHDHDHDHDQAIGTVVRPVLETTGAASLTVPRSLSGPTATALALDPAQVGEWAWRWTAHAPPPQPAEAQVERLDAGDPMVAAELAGLLTTHSPRHSATPGAPGIAGWVGVRRRGRVVACAAWFEPVPGVPLLASVAVHPEARRAGLGAAVTSALTRRALAAGSPAVTVDLYADNDAAARLYRRLGFATAHEFASWSLPGR